MLVNAAAIRDTLIDQGYRPDNIVAIPNGIITAQPSAQESGARLRAELGLPASAQVVIVFSRLNRMKGIEYFLEASVSVSRRFPDARFVIAGDGNNRHELEEYAAHLGVASKTVFTGFRTDLPDILQEAAVSVLPSLSEGLSNSLLESMAAGLPVVATNVGGNPEIVDDEVSGLLVPPRDSAALATAMARILEDPALAGRFGRAGRRRVHEVFSMERSVDSVERLYRRLIQKEDSL